MGAFSLKLDWLISHSFERVVIISGDLGGVPKTIVACFFFMDPN
jgi:hypothetical protein